MKPVKVKTVQVKAGPVKLASATPQPVAVEPTRNDTYRAEPQRAELPAQPPGHGTGNGILGVLPASSLPPSSSQAMA
ncbi:hypothetical protein, partial [Clostridium perfringens]